MRCQEVSPSNLNHGACNTDAGSITYERDELSVWKYGSHFIVRECMCVCVLFTKFLSMFNGNQLLFFPATRNAFSDSSKKTLQKRLSINYQNRFKCMSIFTFLTMNFFSANKQPVARRYFLNTCIVSTEHPL